MKTEAQLIQELRRESEQLSQKATARRLGISTAYICDLLHGRREISTAVALKMGYEQVERKFRKVK